MQLRFHGAFSFACDCNHLASRKSFAGPGRHDAKEAIAKSSDNQRLHRMIDGWFTSKKLGQFIKDGQADYENARTIINGHDKAQTIADIARRFSEVLLLAIT